MPADGIGGIGNRPERLLRDRPKRHEVISGVRQAVAEEDQLDDVLSEGDGNIGHRQQHQQQHPDLGPQWTTTSLGDEHHSLLAPEPLEPWLHSVKAAIQQRERQPPKGLLGSRVSPRSPSEVPAACRKLGTSVCRSARIPTPMDPLDELLGDSAGIVAIRRQVRLLLQRRENTLLPPILIQGETGTGKGHLARLIHRTSPRRDGPFENVDCPSIPGQLFESVMFGVERGAFSDARQPRHVRLQGAHRRTIFLDEIGLLAEDAHRKLLKLIEERTVRRVRGARDEPVDVWIIAATNEDLAAAVREHRFREDLYYRLGFMPLTLPPLRERGEDVMVLAQHLLDCACADHHLPPMTLDPSARAAVLAYDWPGNVRRVRNVMERVALLSEAPSVTREMLDIPAAPAVSMLKPEPGPEIKT